MDLCCNMLFEPLLAYFSIFSESFLVICIRYFPWKSTFEKNLGNIENRIVHNAECLSNRQWLRFLFSKVIQRNFKLNFPEACRTTIFYLKYLKNGCPNLKPIALKLSNEAIPCNKGLKRCTYVLHTFTILCN